MKPSVGSGYMGRRTRCYVAPRPISAKDCCREMMYPLVRELADDGIPVAVTCRVLKVSRQPNYRWLGQLVGEREWDRAQLTNAIFDAHRDDPEFGYRFLADEVRAAGPQRV